VVLLLGAGATEALGQRRPAALEKLERYRAALRTGVVEWSIVDQADDVYGGLERFRTSRFAGEDTILIDRGDRDGVVIRTADGSPAPVVGQRAVNMLQIGGKHWTRPEAPLQDVTIEPRSKRAGLDIRSLGVVAGVGGPDIHDALWRDYVRNPSAWKFEQARQGDLHVVRVRRSTETCTYWLDPERGWSPVRVRCEHKHGWCEARSALKLFDGVWFPEVVEVFSSRYRDGREPVKIIRVHSAAFNRPEHPQRFTPADIGVEVGMNAVVYGDGPRPEAAGKWDGQKVVPPGELAERLRRGELKEGPALVQAASARGSPHVRECPPRPGAGGPAMVEGTPAPAAARRQGPDAILRHFESLWEAYTRRFIKKYRLNEEQTQKALAILKSCQDLASAHLAKHKAEFAQLDKQLRNLANLPAGQRAAERARLERQRESLLRPIEAIFERQLKPRLESLPTRAQRKAAAEGASPASGGRQGRKPAP